MANEKQGFHRAWLVFIGVCMMMAGGMGLVLNVMGNYFAPMALAFGLINPATGGPDVTQVTLLMTVYSYVMLVWLPFCGRLFAKVDARILFGASGIAIVAGLLLMNVWTEVWQIYISGALFGLAGPAILLFLSTTGSLRARLVSSWASLLHLPALAPSCGRRSLQASSRLRVTRWASPSKQLLLLCLF